MWIEKQKERVSHCTLIIRMVVRKRVKTKYPSVRWISVGQIMVLLAAISAFYSLTFSYHFLYVVTKFLKATEAELASQFPNVLEAAAR